MNGVTVSIDRIVIDFTDVYWDFFNEFHKRICHYYGVRMTVGVDELADYLHEASHNTCSTRKAEEILELVKQDGETKRNFQEYRDFLTVNMVKDMRRSRELIKQIEEQLRQVLAQTDYKLESMEGISTVTAAELIAI